MPINIYEDHPAPNLMWHNNILATHEEPQTLAVGPWLGDFVSGVALPSRLALGKWVIINYGQQLWTIARVLDVGPWCVDDDLYLFRGERPRAERLKNEFCPRDLKNDSLATLPNGQPCPLSNGAGIDLFPETARALSISKGVNTYVNWRFICLSDFISTPK